MIKLGGWVLILLGWGAMPLWAEGLPWRQLTFEERQVLNRFKPQSVEMPAGQRWRLQQSAQRWQDLTPQERERAGNRFERWQTLEPERKQEIRQRYERFQQLPAGQQDQLRRRFEWFKNLPEDERMQLREQWRRNAPRSYER
jgi:hypothetical protein